MATYYLKKEVIKDVSDGIRKWLPIFKNQWYKNTFKSPFPSYQYNKLADLEYFLTVCDEDETKLLKNKRYQRIIRSHYFQNDMFSSLKEIFMTPEILNFEKLHKMEGASNSILTFIRYRGYFEPYLYWLNLKNAYYFQENDVKIQLEVYRNLYIGKLPPVEINAHAMNFESYYSLPNTVITVYKLLSRRDFMNKDFGIGWNLIKPKLPKNQILDSISDEKIIIRLDLPKEKIQAFYFKTEAIIVEYPDDLLNHIEILNF